MIIGNLKLQGTNSLAIRLKVNWNLDLPVNRNGCNGNCKFYRTTLNFRNINTISRPIYIPINTRYKIQVILIS